MQLKPINQQVVAVVGASGGIGRESGTLWTQAPSSELMVNW